MRKICPCWESLPLLLVYQRESIEALQPDLISRKPHLGHTELMGSSRDYCTAEASYPPLLASDCLAVLEALCTPSFPLKEVLAQSYLLLLRNHHYRCPQKPGSHEQLSSFGQFLASILCFPPLSSSPVTVFEEKATIDSKVLTVSKPVIDSTCGMATVLTGT